MSLDGARSGLVFIRKPGRTVQADAADMDALQVRLPARTGRDPVEVDFDKRPIEALLDTLGDLRDQVVTVLLATGVTPRSGTPERLAYNRRCEKVGTQLDAVGGLAERLKKSRWVSQTRSFTVQEIDGATDEAREVLVDLAR